VKVFVFLSERCFFSQSSKDYKRSSQTCLRICNRLLQRLSSTRDAEARGRVLQLVAYVFSVDERSGLNIRNAFHTENVTKVDSGNISEAAVAPSFDHKFYLELWELQEFFSNPLILSKDLPKQKRLLELVKAVFSSFSSKAVLKETENLLATEDFFDFPKYLTSPGIFHLQMQDGNFRKQILFQVLILFQFLRLGSKKVTIDVDASTTAAIPGVEEQAKDLVKQCFSNAGAVSELLVHLERETVWMQFKDSGCNKISKSAQELLDKMQKRPSTCSEGSKFSLIPEGEYAGETPEDALEEDLISQRTREHIDDDEFPENLSIGGKDSWMTLRALRRKNLKLVVEKVNEAVKKTESGSVDVEEKVESATPEEGTVATESATPPTIDQEMQVEETAPLKEEDSQDVDADKKSSGVKRKIDEISSE
jgi:hypothetical protein